MPLHHLLSPRALRVLFTTLLAGVGTAQAIPTSAITFPQPTQDATSWNRQSETDGWAFTVTKSINVTALGIFDAGQDGLADPHAIGLWSLPSLSSYSGTLLASTTVPEGTAAPLNGLFRYATITPLILNPGQYYAIGAHYTGVEGYGSIDTDPADRDGSLNPYYYYGHSFAPEITFVAARSSSQQTTGMQFPYYNNPVATNPYLGASFQFTVSSVPDTLPASVLGGALAAVLLVHGSLRRRQRRVRG